LLSEEELKGVPLLIFCNKQARHNSHSSKLLVLTFSKDIEGALSPGKMSEALGLDGEKSREWSIRGSCATKGEGLEEGLDWFVIVFGIILKHLMLTALSLITRLVTTIQKK
jgi:ADP-ribosylation factor-like protein 1